MTSAVSTEESRNGLRDAIVRGYASTFADPLLQGWFEHSGFANFGYWHDDTASAADASRNLVGRLIGMMPETSRKGAVLDVACGAGGTTRELCRHFEPADITAINIAPDQLERAARLVPDVSFRQMDATRLEFAPSTFDVVLCVEASHHFQTRARFLAEAFRVLKPGGCLLVSDVLFQQPLGPLRQIRHELLTRPFTPEPRDYAVENLVASLAAYVDLYRLVGFDDLAVRDEVERTWRTFHRRFRAYLVRKAVAHPRLVPAVCGHVRRFAVWNSVIYAYPLVAAHKPSA